jgi:hypothetical protein
VLNNAQQEQFLAVINKISRKANFGLRLVIMKIKSDIRKGLAL